MPIEIVEHYYQMIQHLNNADKMVLVEKIIHSVNNPLQPLNANNQDGLLGSLEDKKNSQDIQSFSNDVILQKDIDEYSSLDYLAVSEDKTDKNWITNFLAMTEKASQNIATHLPQNERGWTRDDIYER
ncbi:MULTISPECIES: hypothetical protein [unclassified Moraxella]|uniref:hypothetical protein n=1 Tax=unclassified Moraxella TaxID=2685852 RepID=UPI002B401B8A|nr:MULTISPECIES: hypothetical protein [unclassified Moraxella]